MYKCQLIKRGFIDPRRADCIHFNFEISKLEIKHNKNVVRANESMFGFLLRMLVIKKFPIIDKFSGRESFIIIEHFGDEKFDHVRGNGPEPDYPTPDGLNLCIKFNLGNLF